MEVEYIIGESPGNGSTGLGSFTMKHHETRNTMKFHLVAVVPCAHVLDGSKCDQTYSNVEKIFSVAHYHDAAASASSEW